MIAKRSSLVMVLLLALPQAALALGLGTIHLKSHLDQPLDARIDLLDPTPGALQSLSVRLASRTTFTKYGLNWPAYLDGARIKVMHAAGGRIVLHLTSSLPVTDPILTLLVKASWDRGVLFREYTILLNPPVYVPSASQPRHVAIAAPVVGNAQRAAQLPQASAPASTPAPASSALSLPRSVHVHSGETLSGIASRISGGGMDSTPTRQWMVAIYQLNPQAFANNMNVLRAGAVLRIPAASAAQQVAPSAAWREVTRQDSAWRAGQAGSSAGRLRLVAPSGAGAGAGHGTSSAVGALQAQVRALKGQLAQEKRLVQLKSAALAALQAQVATGTRAPAAVPPTATPAVRAPALHRPMKLHPPQPTPATAPAAMPSALGQMVRRYWWALLALVALLIAYGLARVLRGRRESAANDLLRESADGGFAEPAHSAGPIEPHGGARQNDAIDVRETTHEQPRLVMRDASAPVVQTHVAADQTMSSETALNLEQGDPLAEADFHMAYGLYDQAADLIRIAIQREPQRHDLKLKLLEVFFVWGNKEQFVELAHELADTRDQAPAGEWDKVIIMGRQLAPDDPLFAGSEVSGAAAQGVDLDLEGGQGRVDFDLMGGAVPGAAAPGSTGNTGAFDLDIGAALGEELPGDTVAGDDLNESFPDVEATGSENGVTQEMAEHPFEPVEPTVEQPALRVAGQAALREKVEALSQGSERTAELAIDDLGLDLGAFETTVQPSLGADAPTLVAGLDEHSRQMLERAGEAASAERPAAPESTGTTSAWQIDDRELESLLAEEPSGARDTSETSRLSALDAGGVDFDLGATAEPKPAAGEGLDFDIGTATFAHTDVGAMGEGPTGENGVLGDFEPVSMSEVGTKLDLARAYMDMGDPEGARSILEEVMHEGSDVQRQEAGRLLESLPG
ncbi:MAG: FimV/HubP family polar landmark protein [Steroidobacteraceae bacterium]